MEDKLKLVQLGMPTQLAVEVSRQIESSSGGGGQALTVAQRAETKADAATALANEADAAAVEALSAATAAAANTRDAKDLETLLANSTWRYDATGAAQVVAGDVFRTRKEGFSFEATASGASEYDVISAGGIKLRVAGRFAKTISDLVAFPAFRGSQVQVLSFHEGQASGGGFFAWDETRNRSDHDGGWVVSPTVPIVSAQSGADFAAKTEAFLLGTGEASPAGVGCWVRQSDREIDLVENWGLILNSPLLNQKMILKHALANTPRYKLHSAYEGIVGTALDGADAAAKRISINRAAHIHWPFKVRFIDGSNTGISGDIILIDGGPHEIDLLRVDGNRHNNPAGYPGGVGLTSGIRFGNSAQNAGPVGSNTRLRTKVRRIEVYNTEGDAVGVNNAAHVDVDYAYIENAGEHGFYVNGASGDFRVRSCDIKGFGLAGNHPTAVAVKVKRSSSVRIDYTVDDWGDTLNTGAYGGTAGQAVQKRDAVFESCRNVHLKNTVHNVRNGPGVNATAYDAFLGVEDCTYSTTQLAAHRSTFLDGTGSDGVIRGLRMKDSKTLKGIDQIRFWTHIENCDIGGNTLCEGAGPVTTHSISIRGTTLRGYLWLGDVDGITVKIDDCVLEREIIRRGTAVGAIKIAMVNSSMVLPSNVAAFSAASPAVLNVLLSGYCSISGHQYLAQGSGVSISSLDSSFSNETLVSSATMRKAQFT